MCVECSISPPLGRDLHLQGHRHQLEGRARAPPQDVSHYAYLFYRTTVRYRSAEFRKHVYVEVLVV